MDITLEIPTPVLTAPDNFQVSYKLLPSGSVTPVGNETNAPFTITGLEPGDYQLLVEYNGSAVTYCFTVAPCACVSDGGGPLIQGVVMTEMESDGKILYYVQVYFNLFSGDLYIPPCGIQIEIQPAGNTSFTFNITDTTPFLINAVSGTYYVNILSPSSSAIVTISSGYAQCCNNDGTCGTYNVGHPHRTFRWAPTSEAMYSDGQDWYLPINVLSETDPRDSSQIIFQYLQTGPVNGTPDSGLHTITLAASPLPSYPYRVNIPVSPANVLLGNKMFYKLTGIEPTSPSVNAWEQTWIGSTFEFVQTV